ncbi:MAG: 6-bladed beta-propeller [Bacteroidaceae bacterium]|nr:6-bladed beta-propeller [Bacteroidaceae bacterium]
MKKASVKSLQMLLVPALSLLLNGCGQTVQTVDVDNVETVELKKSDSDIRIIPIRCGVPMDEILRGFCYDDYTFLMGMSRKSIYCVREDTVISILESSGRGHGEYSSINDYAYSQEEHILYVYADAKLLKYTVPEMVFLESVDMPITPSEMIVLNSDEILMNCSFMEENGKDVFRGICVVSSHTGEVIERCYEFDYINKKMIMQSDLVQVPGGFVFPLNSFTKNRLLHYDSDSESVEELFSFCFNSNWRVPGRLVKLAKKDPMRYALEDYKETRHLEGGHYPSLIDSGFSFWCFPRENGKARSVAVVVKDGKVSCRSYVVSGTEFHPSPYFIHKGYCVDIVSATDLETADSGALSPLGSELKRIVDAQAYDNPVLFCFKVE